MAKSSPSEGSLPVSSDDSVKVRSSGDKASSSPGMTQDETFDEYLRKAPEGLLGYLEEFFDAKVEKLLGPKTKKREPEKPPFVLLRPFDSDKLVDLEFKRNGPFKGEYHSKEVAIYGHGRKSGFPESLASHLSKSHPGSFRVISKR